MGVDLNGCDYSDLFCFIFCADVVRWYFYDWRKKKMSGLFGTILCVVCVGVLLCPWVSEAIADYKARWTK